MDVSCCFVVPELPLVLVCASLLLSLAPLLPRFDLMRMLLGLADLTHDIECLGAGCLLAASCRRPPHIQIPMVVGGIRQLLCASF